MPDVEQVTEPVQPTPAETAATSSEPQFASSGPWADDIRASFPNPETQAQVDAFLRAKVQPHVTQVEQESAQARQLYDAFKDDPYAAYEAIGGQLFGPDAQTPAPATPAAPEAPQYVDAYGNPVQPVGYDAQGNPVFQPQPPQAAAPPTAGWQFDPVTGQPLNQPPSDPRLDEMYDQWSQQRDEKLYDQAKTQFLSDPANQDINPELFDVFVASAETWEDAAAAYRSYKAAEAQANAAPTPTETAPPQLGNQGGDGASTTPVEQRKSLDQTIDDIFSEQAAEAPPM